MRRDPGEHPNGLIDFALCSTIAYLAQRGAGGLQPQLRGVSFGVLDGERGDGTFTRVERWALKRLSGVLPIESLWTFNAKYHPGLVGALPRLPRRRESCRSWRRSCAPRSITEIPVLGRCLANDPSNRPGTVVPDEVLEAAKRVDREVAAH